uniref:BPTI/Kunitz inhibitor domain-containing protein n=1 Tax=Rhabditophanes sp. KR3021 TaxID=114890 RepID=A0AC35TYZ3_9BILA
MISTYLFGILFLIGSISSASGDVKRCELARDRGTECEQEKSMHFYFDSVTLRCQPFMHLGCGGNDNKWKTFAECKKACKDVKQHSNPKAPKVCKSGVVAATDENGKALTCENCPKQSTCVDGLCCFTPQFTCNLNYDAGKYPVEGKHTPMYFYSKEYHACMLFTYYGSLGNSNRWSTYNSCMNFCKPVFSKKGE